MKIWQKAQLSREAGLRSKNDKRSKMLTLIYWNSSLKKTLTPPYLNWNYTKFSRQAWPSVKVNIRLKVIVMDQIEVNVKIMADVKVQVQLKFKDRVIVKIKVMVQIKATAKVKVNAMVKIKA